jgi:hypothetical protein
MQVLGLDGSPISVLNTGDHFLVTVSAADLRQQPLGVFAAYADLGFTAEVAKTIGQPVFGSAFPNSRHATFAPGNISNIGATADTEPVGGGEKLLFTIEFEAVSEGTLKLALDSAGVEAPNSTLLLGRNVPVLTEELRLDDREIQVAVTNPDNIPPTVSLVSPGLTSDPTPGFTVNAEDNRPLPDGTTAEIAIDLNNDGVFSVEERIGGGPLTNGTAFVEATTKLADGTYTARALVVDPAGNVGNATTSLTIDATSPRATIASVTPDPHASAVSTITIEFSEPVLGLNLEQFSLTRNSVGNLITSEQTLHRVNDQRYELRNLDELTNPRGQYELSLLATSAVNDAAGNPLEATSPVTWTRVPAPHQAVLTASLADLTGNPVLTLRPGDRVRLSVSVADLRQDPQGVFAAFANVSFNADVARVIGEPAFGAAFPNARSAVVSPGEILNIGATASNVRTGGGDELLFAIDFEAVSEGDFTVSVASAGQAPPFSTLLFGQNVPVLDDELRLENSEIQVPVHDPQWHNPVLPADVNHDGLVSPIDALLVINVLNSEGPHRLSGLNSRSILIDVNDDASVSPLDALLVINVLNAAVSSYTVTDVIAGSNQETRLWHGNQHFASLIHQVDGAIILRTHPSSAADAWGSSIFVAPYVGGQGSDSTMGVIDQVAVVSDGIVIRASGKISGLAGVSVGTWGWEVKLRYDPAVSKITSEGGHIKVQLDDALSAAGGDLNLYRVNSNYLDDVPLQEPPGGFGDTGDMQYVDVSFSPEGDQRDFRWTADVQPAHFPTHLASEYLRSRVVGDRNAVSTANLGFEIAVADKPTIQLTLRSRDAVAMTWGGTFDTTEAKNFAADNVGVVALVLRDSTQLTSFSFDWELESLPPPVD